MAFETCYSYTEYLSPYYKYLIGSLRILASCEVFHQRLFWRSKRQNAEVTISMSQLWVMVTFRRQRTVQKYLLAAIIVSYYLKMYFFERKFSDEHQSKLPKMWYLKLTVDFYWKFQPKMTTILF